MSDLAPTLLDDDISQYAFATTIALAIVVLLAGIVSLVPLGYATAADVPSLAQFFI